MKRYKAGELSSADVEDIDSQLVRDFYRIRRQREEVRKLDRTIEDLKGALSNRGSKAVIREGNELVNDIDNLATYDAHLAQMVVESGLDLPSFRKGERKEYLDRLLDNYRDYKVNGRVLKTLKKLGIGG